MNKTRYINAKGARVECFELNGEFHVKHLANGEDPERDIAFFKAERANMYVNLLIARGFQREKPEEGKYSDDECLIRTYGGKKKYYWKVDYESVVKGSMVIESEFANPKEDQNYAWYTGYNGARILRYRPATEEEAREQHFASFLRGEA